MKTWKNVIKLVCLICLLHDKQTTGAVWDKINSTRLKHFDMVYDMVVICLLLKFICLRVPVLTLQSLGRLYAVLLRAVFFYPKVGQQGQMVLCRLDCLWQWVYMVCHWGSDTRSLSCCSSSEVRLMPLRDSTNFFSYFFWALVAL